MRRVGAIVSFTGIAVAIALVTLAGPFDSLLALAQGRQGASSGGTAKPYTT